MSGLILCNLSSKEPYYITELNIKVFSIEEIGYFLFNHAHLVGKDFFNENLLKYLKEDLKLTKVSEKLEEKLENDSPLGDLIYLLVSESGYFNNEDLREFSELLPQVSLKSTHERFKAKADVFYEYNKYESAIHEYYKILNLKRDFNLSSSFYGDILNKIGTIYSKLFLFEEALEYFKKAYDLSRDERYIRNILNICFILDDEKKILEHTVKYELEDIFVEICKEEFEEIKNEVEKGKSHVLLKEKLSYEMSNEIGKSNIEFQDLIDEWKEDYRDLMV